jgi:hypothetical protein
VSLGLGIQFPTFRRKMLLFGLPDPEHDGTTILQTSGNITPTTQCHILADLHLHQHQAQNLEFRNKNNARGQARPSACEPKY